MALARFGCVVVAVLLSVSQVPAQEIDLEELFHCDHDSFYVQGNLAGSVRSAKVVGGSDILELGFNDRDPDATLGLGGAVGFCDLCSIDSLGDFRIRKELEGMWQGSSNHSISGSDGFNPPVRFNLKVNQWTAMGNLWVDKPLTDGLFTYVGGGMGVAGTDFQFLGSTRSTTQFAYQVGGGITYQTSESCELDLGYRFLDTGDALINITGGNVRADLRAHQIMLSLRWYLW